MCPYDWYKVLVRNVSVTSCLNVPALLIGVIVILNVKSFELIPMKWEFFTVKFCL